MLIFDQIYNFDLVKSPWKIIKFCYVLYIPISISFIVTMTKPQSTRKTEKNRQTNKIMNIKLYTILQQKSLYYFVTRIELAKHMSNMKLSVINLSISLLPKCQLVKKVKALEKSLSKKYLSFALKIK